METIIVSKDDHFFLSSCKAITSILGIAYVILYVIIFIAFVINIAILGDSVANTMAMLLGKDIEIPPSFLSYLIVFISMVCMPAFFEEVLFRKILYYSLHKYDEKTYIFASTALFAVFHSNLFQLLLAIIAGFVIGQLYCKTQNLKQSIMIHFGINFVSLIIVPLASMISPLLVVLLVLFFMIGGIIQFKVRKKALRNREAIAILSGSIMFVLCIILGLAFIIIPLILG